MGRSISGSLVLAALAACVCHAVLVSANPTAANSDEITLKWEKIFVDVEDGPTFSLMVGTNDTVENLIEYINELEGLPWFWINPRVGNTTLDLYTQLSEYIRGPNATVTVPVTSDQCSATQEFIVKTLDGRELPVKTQLSNTVAQLKDNITQWSGIQQAQQRLLFKGKELKDDRKLALYDILYNTKIELGRPLEECRDQVVTILVKTLNGATIKIALSLADTVNRLKEKIREQTGVPVGVQRLFVSERPIAGEDHLCDLNLGPGSIVYMFLYSTQITSLDQVARLREVAVDPHHKAPIFHEADDDQVRASFLRDERNWFIKVGQRLDLNVKLFDPIAHLGHNPDDDIWWTKDYQATLDYLARPDPNELVRNHAQNIIGSMKLSLAVRSYRVAANLTAPRVFGENTGPGITLGGDGGFTQNGQEAIPLGADLNNWAPDAFSDLDVMRLFEVSERARRVLARSAQTGEGLLGIEGQRRINSAILLTYIEALAGYAPSAVWSEQKEGNDCGICRDDLTAEPNIKLPCEHSFHADCLVTWVMNLKDAQRVPTCPLCRQRFMFPYEALGKAELEKPEMQIN